jgi:hypothetical protein
LAQQVNLKAKGLHTYENQLSSIPEGALLEATNVLITRTNTIQPRRGYKIYGDEFGTSVNRCDQLINYKDTVLRHFSPSLQFDTGDGVFATFSGSYTEPETGIRIKSQEAGGNLYYTTNEGIKKISAKSSSDFSTNAGYILDAGAPKAIEIAGTMNYIDPGFMTTESKVAYRVVWGYRDANNLLVLGVPSPRAVVTNVSADTTGTIDLTINIPNGVTENFFYQIYRTAIVQRTQGLTFEDIDPGDEQYLIFEGTPTTAEISAQEVEFNDITPDDFRAAGALLYTNPISGGGIQSANEIPPLAKDIELYKDNMFYANTQTRHRLFNSLLTIGDFENVKTISAISAAGPTNITTSADHELNSGDVIYIYNSDSTPSVDGQYTITKVDATNFTIPVTVTIAGSAGTMSQIPQILITDSEGSTSEVFGFRGVTEVTEITTVDHASLAVGPDYDYMLINSHSNLRKYFFWFNTDSGTDAPSGNGDLSGRIPIEVEITGGATANDVAGLLSTALNDVGAEGGDFDASANLNVVTVTNNFNGDVDDAANGTNDPGFSYNVTTQGVGEDFGSNLSILSSLSSVALQVDQTARSLVENVNKSSLNINAFYQSGSSDVPGQYLLEKNDVTDAEFYISSLTARTTDNFNSELSKASNITAITTGTTSPEITTLNDHGFVIGDEVYISDTTTIPAILGKHTITAVNSSTTYEVSIPVALISATIFGYTFKPTVVSDNETKPNRIYYSKFQQFEAVPTLNYFDVGPQDEPIERILALRDSLFIFKTDGVYRLGGENENNFNVALFDRTSHISAPDSAVALNNQIYMLSSDGVATVSDTGISIISRPVENEIRVLTSDAYSNQRTSAFGVPYESERFYMLFLNTLTSDTTATQCFIFNYFTQSWTKFDINKTCGIIGSDDKLYFGAGDTNFVEIERKDFDRKDYADREFDISMGNDAVSDEGLTVSSTANTEVGDVIEQIQYVTISQFNRLLKKLDIDPGLDDSDYNSTLGMVSGDNLTTQMTSLTDKLSADDSTETYVFSGTTDFATIQTEYNTMVDQLNNSTEVFYANYSQSSGTIEHEAAILEVDKAVNIVDLTFTPPFMVGPLVLYKAIESSVVWAPQFMEDPTVYKHFREGTFVFLERSFSGATISYKSDLSPNFEEITFTFEGNGAWGSFNWGENNWGGAGSQVPLRTLVPTNKQRCRYISPKLEHKVARETYLLLGASLTGEAYSTRAYR